MPVIPGRPRRRRSGIAFLAAALGACLVLPPAGPAAAEPPPWAPAHGWRAKHDRDRDRDRDRVIVVPVPTVVERDRAPSLPYGFGRGTCDRGLISGELLGNLAGGALGGLAGSRFGEGNGKIAAVIGGTLLGTLVGGAVGRSMDPVDQACAVTALHHVPDDRRITWSRAGTDYAVTPTRTFTSAGRTCRAYTSTAIIDGRREAAGGTACLGADGVWEIVN